MISLSSKLYLTIYSRVTSKTETNLITNLRITTLNNHTKKNGISSMRRKNPFRKRLPKNCHIRKIHKIFKINEKLKMYQNSLISEWIYHLKYLLHNLWDIIQMSLQFRHHISHRDITHHMDHNLESDIHMECILLKCIFNLLPVCIQLLLKDHIKFQIRICTRFPHLFLMVQFLWYRQYQIFIGFNIHKLLKVVRYPNNRSSHMDINNR